ncbi:spirocyclase AveC family protein [Streptomyces klenkii]
MTAADRRSARGRQAPAGTPDREAPDDRHPRPSTGPIRTRSRQPAPAIAFAALGTAALLAQAWILTRWAIAGGIRPGARPPGAISPGRTALTRTLQGAVAAAVILTAFLLIRRSRRAGHVAPDTALFAGFILCFWQDPLLNYARIAVNFNHYDLTVSTWGPFIPGWHGPHPGQQVQSVINGDLGYGLVILWVLLMGAITTRVARRRPRWGWNRLLPVSVAAGTVMNFTFQFPWILAGGFGYAAPVRPLTIFADHWYNYPFLNTSAWLLLVITPLVVMRHTAAARGTPPLLFHGIDHLGGRPANLVRLLAGIGLTNILMLTYMTAHNLLTALGGPMPPDTPGFLWPLALR